MTFVSYCLQRVRMDTKLWTALYALMLIHIGSTDHGNPSESPVVATEAAAVPRSSLEATSHPPPLNGPDTNISSNGTSSLSSNTTSPQTPGLKENNDTSSVSSSVSVAPENNANTTNTNKTQESTQPPIIPPTGNDTTSHTPTTSTTTTNTSSTQTTHSAPVVTELNNTSSHLASLSPDSISLTVQPTYSTHSSTATTISTSTQSSSTSSTSSSQEPKKSTVKPPIRTATQAKANVDTPSQLNVGDMTMVQKSPTLDPLLPSLVSAFIITAVIIILLLFLKLRRRQNRPEFRRLQDLPMDDMMEDTPLSMYSY